MVHPPHHHGCSPWLPVDAIGRIGYKHIGGDVRQNVKGVAVVDRDSIIAVILLS